MTGNQFFFMILTLVLTGGMALLTRRSADVLRTLPPGRSLLTQPLDLVMRVIIILWCVGLGWLSGATPAQLGWTSPTAWRDLALGAALGGAAHLVLYPLTTWLAALLGPAYYSLRFIRHILPQTNRQWLALPLALALAVLLEELLFRSLLVGGIVALAPAARADGVALVLAGVGAVIFGWMHSPQGQLGMLAAGGMGLLLSLLFVAFGSLYVPFAAHFVYNLLTLARASGDPRVVQAT